MRREIIILGVVVTASLLGSLTFVPRKPEPRNLDLRSAEAKRATLERVEANKPYSTGDHKLAEQQLPSFIDEYEGSTDPDTQDQVAAARMTMGYIASSRKDFGKAKERFEELEANYIGTHAENPEFGKITDQAAYQAIVCLQAEGKTDEAVEDYVAFLKDRWDSPLVFAVHKRLKAIGPKDEQEEYEALLQNAITKKEDKIRHDLSMCGPNAIAYLQKAMGDVPKTTEELAKLCKTTDDGTTMANMAAALGQLGYNAEGYRLNLSDFQKVRVPSLWLINTHYVVVTGWTRDKVSYYDPMTKSVREIDLKDQKTTFTADVLEISRKLKEARS